MEAGDGDLRRRLKQLSDTWLDRAKEFERHACNGVAAAYRQTANDLDTVVGEWEDELLTIADAAPETGYSEDHLRRLVREGKLFAERGDGKKSHIRLRRGDLPSKPTGTKHNGGNNKPDDTYDPEEDARDIAKRLRR